MKLSAPHEKGLVLSIISFSREYSIYPAWQNEMFWSIIFLYIDSTKTGFPNFYFYFWGQGRKRGEKNGTLLPKLFLPTVRKNCSSDRENFLKFETEGRKFAKITRSRTICSNSERSEQFLVTECFFNLILKVSQI